MSCTAMHATPLRALQVYDTAEAKLNDIVEVVGVLRWARLRSAVAGLGLGLGHVQPTLSAIPTLLLRSLPLFALSSRVPELAAVHMQSEQGGQARC